jgi:glycosidase
MKKHIILLAGMLALGFNSVIAQPADWPENPIIYEVNLRHHTPEGTLASFKQELRQLKGLGVNVLWFMPVQPIGEKKRKAKGDLFVEDIKEPAEKLRYLGSPYSIRNYTQVNPDFGTLQEFKSVVKLCHEMGMKVILDWVGNHTAWDHPWIAAHPDWYTKDKNGNITDPLNEEGNSMGWTDVADLNYGSQEMRAAMIQDMKYWVKECDIDGFRCDVAMSVPADFWDAARKEIETVKPIFMLAESEEHDMAQFKGAFNAYYGWELHHVMNQVAKGKRKATFLDTTLSKKLKKFPGNVYSMNFITNHDENSWNGTEFERMKDAWKAMAVFTFTAPGIPLLYTGQEYGNNRRLRFFEKDTIQKRHDFNYFGFYSLLCDLRKYHGLGTSAASNNISFIPQKSPNLLVFTRGNKEHTYWVCLNLSESAYKKRIKIPKGALLMGTPGKKLGPWAYKVLQLK